MSNCLGLYIQNNIIKYAKISKKHDDIKVDSFGVKFYDNDNINVAIKQVIEETYSYKTPISINLSEEIYNYFDMFALLNKKDLQQAIKTEFESYCTDKGYNPNVFETRYAVVENQEDNKKLKVLNISTNKMELNKKSQYFSEYKLTNISPISMSISNIAELQEKENILIINIEDKTTVTTITDKKVYNVDIIEQGCEDFLNQINLRENSYSKAYEICKNTTIYTSEGKDLQDTDTGYLELIMPVLYSIAGQVRKIINESLLKIGKVYITGTAALINNIDLYFQEYFSEVDCEVLKPFFINNTKEISIKDYIEVNSAISMALMGLNEGVSGMNFKKVSLKDKMSEVLKLDINPQRNNDKKKDVKGFFSFDLTEKLDKTEVSLIRVASGLLLLVLIYSGFSSLLNNQMENKKSEAIDYINDINKQISLANTDSDKIKSKSNEYTTMIKNLQEISEKVSDRNKNRNIIPNLLNQIMFIVPENVQITSIQNTTDRHIEIYAKSNKYEQLGYLKAKIDSDNILTNVVSTSGQKESNVVTIKIEGDLP